VCKLCLKRKISNFDGAPCAVKVARTVLSGGKAGNIWNCRLTYRNLARMLMYGKVTPNKKQTAAQTIPNFW